MILHKNKPLSEILFYKIGGTAQFVLEATSVEDIFEAVSFIKQNKIDKYLVVGLGSNILMHDEDFSGAVIWIHAHGIDIHQTADGLASVFAGQTIDELIQFSFSDGLIGLESLGGLPSTVGGAIRGNAGAFGIEIKDVIEKVEYIDFADETTTSKELTFDACQFAYRDSIFKHNPTFIIIKGFFKLAVATDEEVKTAKKIYHDSINYRKEHHPVEYPSCGSVFKNVKGQENVRKILSVWPDIKELVEKKWYGKVSMGYIIKRLGFSGVEVGGAKITEKHANYISNVDHAKAADVLTIINQIKDKFHKTFGFYPELEAELILK